MKCWRKSVKKRGFVISGGEIDMERAANMVLDELRGAKIGHITLETPSQLNEQDKLKRGTH